MYCPHCRKNNKCNCSNCNPQKLTGDYEIYIGDDIYQCVFCGLQFNGNGSLDIEWELMQIEISEKISKELCVEWLVGNSNIRNLISEKVNTRQYDFEMMVNYYFNIPFYSLDKTIITQIKRDFDLEQILKNSNEK
jgi:hypothetical protein